MARKHVTQDDAYDALCDPSIPVPDAIKLFKRAYRRSNAATQAFVLITSGALRERVGLLVPPRGSRSCQAIKANKSEDKS